MPFETAPTGKLRNIDDIKDFRTRLQYRLIERAVTIGRLQKEMEWVEQGYAEKFSNFFDMAGEEKLEREWKSVGADPEKRNMLLDAWLGSLGFL